MRIRSTKPEFWRSARVAGVSWDARLVLKGIESYVDDNGVGKDNLALIVADVFPHDLSGSPTGTLQKVSEALSELENAGLLWRYDHEGDRLLYVAFWESIQRIEKPSKGRLPRPDGTLEYRDSEIRECSGSSPGVVREPSGQEQGNRGTGEQGNRSLLPDADASRDEPDEHPNFEQFWNAYDHKHGRKRAATAYAQALKKRGVTTESLLQAAEVYVENLRRQGKHPEFTKHATTWLHGEHWNDEPITELRSLRDHLPDDDEQPPDGLTADEYSRWDHERRQRLAERRQA